MDRSLSIIVLLILTGLLLLAIRRGLIADETLTRFASVATIAGFFLAVFVLFLQDYGLDEPISEATVTFVQSTDTVSATDLSPTPTLTLSPSPAVQPSSTLMPFTPTNVPPTVVPSNTSIPKMSGKPAWIFPSPPDGEILPYGLVVTLAWTSVPDAVEYQLQQSVGGGWLPSGCGENGWMTSTSCRMGMQVKGDAAWRLIARNALGQESEPSDILRYSVAAVPNNNASMPGKPAWTNPSPANNSIFPIGAELTIAWTSVPDAMEYQLQYFSDGNWLPTGCGENGWMTQTGCYWQPTSESDVILRVIARNALGQESEPSDILRFIIKNQ